LITSWSLIALRDTSLQEENILDLSVFQFHHIYLGTVVSKVKHNAHNLT